MKVLSRNFAASYFSMSQLIYFTGGIKIKDVSGKKAALPVTDRIVITQAVAYNDLGY